MITLNEAKQICKSNSNYYIAWTYGGYENERYWATKKECEDFRNYNNVPEFAPTKAKAAEWWPALKVLVMKKSGLESNIIYDRIDN